MEVTTRSPPRVVEVPMFNVWATVRLTSLLPVALEVMPSFSVPYTDVAASFTACSCMCAVIPQSA